MTRHHQQSRNTLWPFDLVRCVAATKFRFAPPDDTRPPSSFSCSNRLPESAWTPLLDIAPAFLSVDDPAGLDDKLEFVSPQLKHAILHCPDHNTFLEKASVVVFRKDCSSHFTYRCCIVMDVFGPDVPLAIWR